jgi:hypothetical protein
MRPMNREPNDSLLQDYRIFRIYKIILKIMKIV